MIEKNKPPDVLQANEYLKLSCSDAIIKGENPAIVDNIVRQIAPILIFNALKYA